MLKSDHRELRNSKVKLRWVVVVVGGGGGGMKGFWGQGWSVGTLSIFNASSPVHCVSICGHHKDEIKRSSFLSFKYIYMM